MSHDRPRSWLVCYDVRDPKRLRAVYDTMRAYGDHLQYSVFRCVLTDKVRASMVAELSELIHHERDQILLVQLGDPERSDDRIRTLGQPLTDPERVVRVVG